MLLEKFQALLAENGSLKLAQKWDTFCGEGRIYQNYLKNKIAKIKKLPKQKKTFETSMAPF